MRGAKGDAGGGVQSVEDVLSIEGTGTSAGVNVVAVIDGRPVVAARYGKAPGVSNREGIRGVDAPRLRMSVQVHACIDRRAVVVRRAILEGIDGGDGAVGVDIAELRALVKY